MGVISVGDMLVLLPRVEHVRPSRVSRPSLFRLGGRGPRPRTTLGPAGPVHASFLSLFGARRPMDVSWECAARGGSAALEWGGWIDRPVHQPRGAVRVGRR